MKLLNIDHERRIIESLQQSESLVTLLTSDGSVTASSGCLRVLSPLIRDILPSISSSDQHKPVITCKDFSSRSVELFMELLNNEGAIREPLTKGEINQIVNIAATFRIDMQDRQVIPIKTEFRTKPNLIENISFEYQKDVKLEKDGEYFETANFEDSFDVKEALTNSTNSVNESSEKDSLMNAVELSCSLCDNMSTSKQKLRLHYAHKHFSKVLYREAAKYHTGDKTCTICSRPFKTTQQFNLHIGLKHRLIDEILGKEGVLANSPKVSPSHIKGEKTNNNDKEKNCQLCPKTTKGLGALYQHYSNAHLSKEIVTTFAEFGDFSNFKCLLCSKTFRQKNGLIIHLGSNHLLVNDLLAKKGLEELEVREFKRVRKISPSPHIVHPQQELSPSLGQVKSEVVVEMVNIPDMSNYYLDAFDLNVLL